MVKIRLKRIGAKKRPVYRLVVADSRSPRDGRFIEAVGFYDPLPQPATVKVDEARVREWLARGARPSDSARWLLVREGILPALPRPLSQDTRAGAADPGTAAAAGAAEATEAAAESEPTLAEDAPESAGEVEPTPPVSAEAEAPAGAGEPADG